MELEHDVLLFCQRPQEIRSAYGLFLLRQARDVYKRQGHDDVHSLSLEDLVTVNREIAEYTFVPHV